MSERKETELVVAAIDFGTTFSGYAFSFRHEFETDPLRVAANNWTIGSHIAMKTSTCVLFDPGKQFHSFGSDAEDKYGYLSCDGEHTKWYYFRRFKMLLYNSRTINRLTILTGENGNELPAIEVFSAAIRYLSEHLVRSVNMRVNNISPDEIKWVLTVPAIWSDAAKQFTREAAEKAGIPGDHLVLALEPEAASMFCKYLPMNKIAKGSEITRLTPGSQYLVLDAGGGTIDITIHEVQRDGTLHELFKANGGPWGGTTVDREFLIFLERILGREVVERFKQENQEDYVELLREFEVRKRSVTPELDSCTTFRIPISLHEVYRDFRHGELCEAVREIPGLAGKITFAGDKLRADPEIVKSFFKNTCDAIVKHLIGIFQEPRTKDVISILMVGGFSESPMIVDAVTRAFPDKRIISPHEAGLAVLKGAVIFGHDQNVIRKRICKYTYGIKMWSDFDPRRHPESRKLVSNGRYQVRGAFHKLVEVGQPVSPEDSYEGVSCAAVEGTGFTVKLFASADKDPIFVDDPGCTSIGEVEVACKLGESATVTLVFGGTEMEVHAVHNRTHAVTTSKFNFLA